MISDKGLYGMFSGVVTTIALQPFQNIKMALMLPPKQLNLSKNFIANLYHASKYIWLSDGWRGFYHGLVAASLKAALGCYIYFTGLRFFQFENTTAGKNFGISFLSRLTSTFLTNPLNLIETRFQLTNFHGYNSIFGAVKSIYVKEGLSAFFSGGLTSCIKESAFGGLYYMFYEELKDLQYSKLNSGVMAGMVATAITHPLEIIRAKLQTMGLVSKQNVADHLLYSELKKMKQNGGWMKGLAPRLIKKPIANTLTFLIFEGFENTKQVNKK